jgi:hypothetical protein
MQATVKAGLRNPPVNLPVHIQATKMPTIERKVPGYESRPPLMITQYVTKIILVN